MLRADNLSERQRRILDGLVAGKSNSVLAGELGITLDGVKWHVSEMLGDAGFASRRELANWWRRETSPRAVPAALPLRIAAHPSVAAVARIVAVLALAAALAAVIYAVATRDSGAPGVVVTDASAGRIAYIVEGDVWTKPLPDGAPARITTDGGNGSPRWSHSGGWLIVWNGDHARVMRADGSRARDIDGHPAWSPVADQLAYVDAGGAIVVEDAAGSGRVVAAPTPADPATTTRSGVAWSPDGRRLAYSELRAQPGAVPPYAYAGIWAAQADGSGARELYNTGDPPRDGAFVAGWSPEGNAVFVAVDPSFSASAPADGLPVIALRADGAGAQPRSLSPALLTHDGLWSSQPASSLVAVTDGAGREMWTNKRIALMSWASGTLTGLTDASMAALAPAFSPDGQHIAFAAAPDVHDIAGGDPAKAALAQRRIWTMAADGSRQQQITSDAVYRDERPLWSADGARILFARLDPAGRASLWTMRPDGSDLRIAVDDVSLPHSLLDAPPWFGYYGYTGWDEMFDWWRPSVSAPSAPPAAGHTFRDDALGIELRYPAAWTQGAPVMPYASCVTCDILGPPDAAYPYGIEVFAEQLDPGCTPACYNTIRALPLGPAVTVRIGGVDASRVEFERQAPLGLASETGDYTPYREIWTMVPWRGRALFVTAFYRYGDTEAERETRAAYAGALATASLLGP